MFGAANGGVADAPDPAWMTYLNTPTKRSKTTPISPLQPLRPDGYMGVDVTPAPAPAPVAPRPAAPKPSATGQYSFDPSGGGSSYTPAGGPPSLAGPIMSDEDYLTKDDIYQSLLRRYNENEGRFKTEQDRQAALMDSNAVEQKAAFNKQQGLDLNDLLENFAGRGVVRSTGYGNSVNDTNNAYAQRLAAVDQNLTRAASDRAASLADFLQNKQSDIEQARSEALARKLAQYGM